MVTRSVQLLISLSALICLSGPAFAVDPASPTAVTQSDIDWTEFDQAIAAARSNMMSDPAGALLQAEAAEGLLPIRAEAEERQRALATSYWLQAEAINRTNAPLKADEMLERALQALGNTPDKDSLRGDILLSKARIAQRIGNIQTALVSLEQALQILRQHGNARSQASALQKLGDIHLDARDYEKGISYYDQSREVYDEDPNFVLFYYNNKATALRGLERYGEAAELYEQGLEYARSLGAPDHIVARILTNLAHTYTLAGDNERAEAFADESLELMGEDELSEWQRFVWGVKAEIAFDRGELTDARRYIERTFQDFNLNETTALFREMHQTAYQIYQSLGLYSLAFEHLQAFKRLEDEALSLAASTNSALMSAQFDFTNQELRIERLSAQRLEQDFAIAQAKARQRLLLLGSTVFGGVLILAFLLAGYISMRKSRDAIGRVNDKLNDTNRQLEKANKAKSEFLATTSHEIRTPLNGILGMSQAILQDKSLSEDLRDRLRVVETAGKSMKAIVDDLLDVAKIETGKVTLNTGPIDLHGLIDDACRLWRDAIEQKGLTLVMDLGNSPSRVEGDEQRLRQILFNLLSNAVKFTEQGEITIALSYDDQTEPGRLKVSVKDTGIGIPEAEFTNIFKPFHQVDGAMTRKYAGTGLGLSIVRTFCEAMDGEVSVRSRENEGSEFVIDVPLKSLSIGSSAGATEQAVGHELPANVRDVHLLIFQEDFMQKMVMEAYFADEMALAEVVDQADDFIAGVASGRFHFAVFPADMSDELVPMLAASGVTDGPNMICMGEDAQLTVPEDIVHVQREYDADAILTCIEAIVEPKQGVETSGSPQETASSAA